MRKHVAPTPLSWMVHFQILRLLCFHDPKVWCVCVGVADTCVGEKVCKPRSYTSNKTRSYASNKTWSYASNKTLPTFSLLSPLPLIHLSKIETIAFRKVAGGGGGGDLWRQRRGCSRRPSPATAPWTPAHGSCCWTALAARKYQGWVKQQYCHHTMQTQSLYLLSSQSDFLQNIQMIISGLGSRNFSFSDVCLVDVGRCSNQWSNPSEDLFALYLWIPRIPRVTFMICDVGWTHIEDKEEPAPVDEDDGAGDHGHQPGGRHADDPGEEGWEGAVAQPGTETPGLGREAAITTTFQQCLTRMTTRIEATRMKSLSR